MAKSRHIVFNGKGYTFTPGENGSLISDEKKPGDTKNLLGQAINYNPVAKTIMQPDLKEMYPPGYQKKRQGIAKTLGKYGG